MAEINKAWEERKKAGHYIGNGVYLDDKNFKDYLEGEKHKQKMNKKYNR